MRAAEPILWHQFLHPITNPFVNYRFTKSLVKENLLFLQETAHRKENRPFQYASLAVFGVKKDTTKALRHEVIRQDNRILVWPQRSQSAQRNEKTEIKRQKSEGERLTTIDRHRGRRSSAKFELEIGLIALSRVRSNAGQRNMAY